MGGVRWAAAGDKYFTVAAVPFPETPPRDRGCKQQAIDASTAEVALSFATRTLAPGEKTEYPFIIFAGPEYAQDLDAVRPGRRGRKLADAVDVTFAALSRPMLALLKQFYRLSGNWGIAIILLTIFVRLVTFYPTHRTLVSAKKMQGLSGKIAELRKKFENDKQKLGVETMNLYKAHGVSPFGGCLPSLIQMPIWIALFSTLNYSVEIYHSSVLLVHHRSLGKGSLLPGAPAHGLGDVPANAHVTCGNGSPATEDDVGDDAGHVHRLLALPARRSFHLHADQLSYRHSAAALRQSTLPRGPYPRAGGENLERSTEALRG